MRNFVFFTVHTGEANPSSDVRLWRSCRDILRPGSSIGWARWISGGRIHNNWLDHVTLCNLLGYRPWAHEGFVPPTESIPSLLLDLVLTAPSKATQPSHCARAMPSCGSTPQPLCPEWWQIGSLFAHNRQDLLPHNRQDLLPWRLKFQNPFRCRMRSDNIVEMLWKIESWPAPECKESSICTWWHVLCQYLCCINVLVHAVKRETRTHGSEGMLHLSAAMSKL